MGTTYITAGGGGQVLAPGFYPGGLSRVATAIGDEIEAAPWAAPERVGDYSTLCADFVPSTAHEAPTLQLRAYNTNSSVIDQVVLTRPTKRRPATPSDDTPAIVAGATALAIAGVGAAGIAALQHARRNRSVAEADGGGPRHAST